MTCRRSLSYTVATDGSLDGTPESAASVAAALAKRINALAPADYTATTDGSALVIVNRAGHRFTMADLFVVDTDQTGLDGTASVSLLTLQGAPVVGRDLGGAPDLRRRGATRFPTRSAAGETVANIVSALALGLSTSLGGDFTGIADGNDLILIRRSAGGFQASFESQAAPFGNTVATSSIVTLTGHASWRRGLDGVTGRRALQPDRRLGETVQSLATRFRDADQRRHDTAGGEVRGRRGRRAAGRRQPRRHAVRDPHSTSPGSTART